MQNPDDPTKCQASSTRDFNIFQSHFGMGRGRGRQSQEGKLRLYGHLVLAAAGRPTKPSNKPSSCFKPDMLDHLQLTSQRPQVFHGVSKISQITDLEFGNIYLDLSSI